jgi:putative colanic acid biosynthesis UDP-glucose lipid carrier transferase
MNRQFERYLQISLVILDILVINILYFLTQVSLNEESVINYHYTYVKYWLISNLLWLFLCFFLRTYAGKIILNFEFFTKRSIQVYLLWILFVLSYLFFSNEFKISHLFLLSNIVGFGLGLMLNRFLYLGIKSYFKKSHYLIKKVIIVGYNDLAKKLAKYLEEDGINIELLGFIENQSNIFELSHYPILSDINLTLPIAKQLGVQEIFSTITPEQNNDIYKLMYLAEKECIRFKIVPNLSVFITREIHIDYFGDLPVLSLRSEPLDDVGNRIKKRFLDILFSLFVIILILSWLVPLLGMLIFLESGGPIFFKQLRTGKDNKVFYCWKFRSMRSNKEAHSKQATKNDARITKIGKIIRRTSIDEFPQFINVFRGEMSLVGPRPHMVKHTSDYSKVVNEYMVRQFIKPGITGWAQIHGYRGEIKNPEQIQMRVDKDLWYLENWTLWLDIQIIFLTLYYVIKGDKQAF